MFFLYTLSNTSDNPQMTNSEDIYAYFLVGPTASGKTAIAQIIAERNGYNILSSDSMLVYKGMNIGTAKPSQTEQDTVCYDGIDLATPDHSFNTWDYRLHAIKALQNNAAEDKTTIITGGTGLYVKSLTDGLSQLPDPDLKIRAYWENILETDGVERVAEELIKRNHILYDAIDDKKNGRRIIRALELDAAGIKTPPDSWHNKKESTPILGLQMPREDLRSRIETRVHKMYDDGLLKEAELLQKTYGNLSPAATKAIGYAEAFEVINGECSIEDAKKRTITRTNRLAKRQMTWFKKQADVVWLDITADTDIEDIVERVLKHWSEHGKTKIVK